MAAMDRFDHILNWRLKQGSHTFPGQDGGTCINEAAIVRQADLLAPEEVQTRLVTAQQSAITPTPVPDSAVFAKIKSWFAPIS
jgi:hypothetical protein